MFARMRVSEEKPEKSIMAGEKRDSEPVFMHRLFEEGILKYASREKPALIYEDEEVPERQTKYRELNQNANQIANALLNLLKTTSAKANQDEDWIIAVCMKPSDNLVTTLLAIWKAGAAYLPIDANFPQNRVEHILNEAKPVLVIHDDFYRSSKFFSAVESITFRDLKRTSVQLDSGNIDDELTLTKGGVETKAIVLFTSGSSGSPKGVRIRHHQFIHRIYWQLDAYPYADNEHYCVAKTALTFVDHIAELWCPLFTGRGLIIIPRAFVKDPERFVSILEDYRIQRLVGVPTLLRTVLLYLNMAENNKTKFLLTSLKIWISSGETLNLQLAKEFFDYFDNGRQALLNLYGCTEISCEVSSYEISSKKQLEPFDRVPIGKVFPNTIIYILDKYMKPVNHGEIGEICCAGVMVTDGYIGGHSVSDAFLQNPFEIEEPYNRLYRTGDYGYIKDDLLYYEGRRDTQIKIRGHRVDISEVEKNVDQLSYVEKSAILVYHAGQLDQALVAYITTRNVAGGAVKKTSMEVEKDLKERLTEYMIPRVHVIDEFPYLPSGKVDRQELLSLYEETVVTEGRERKAEHKVDLKRIPKEKRDLAKQVFEIICESLGSELRDKISVKSNFFALGGNSLNSIYTVTQLQSKGFYISIGDFINAENLGDVLNKVSVKPKPNNSRFITKMKLFTEPLNHMEREECIQLLAKSFTNKSDLDRLLPELKEDHYAEILKDMWDLAVKEGLSFMAKNERSELVGVALNFDSKECPEIKTSNPLRAIAEFFNSIERPIVQNKLEAALGEVFKSYMLGTDENLNAKDNIGVIAFMEQENIKLAKSKGFKGIFTTNTNPLTQHFGEIVLGYETLKEIPVNEHVDNTGRKPFEMAPDLQKVVMMYKSLEHDSKS